MSLLYIFAATPEEGEPVRKIGVVDTPGSALRCGPNDFELMIAGMGPTSAKEKAGLAFSGGSFTNNGRKPDAVLVIGLCGGLSPSLSKQRIVAYTECLSTEGKSPPLTCSQTITDSVVALLSSSNISCDRVVGITSSRFAISRSEKLELAQSGAGVVDMESYSIMKAAGGVGIPVAVIRVVSDTVDFELPDFNRALNEAGIFDSRKALKIALASPIRTVRLLTANRRAMEHLAKALQIVLKGECFP